MSKMLSNFFMGLTGSVQDAYEQGFQHGEEGVVSRHICQYTIGTPQREAWQRGYDDGEIFASSR